MHSVRFLAAWTAAGLVIAACGAPLQYTRTVDEGDLGYVRLEARYGEGKAFGYDSAAMEFAHPVSLDEQQWDHILQELRVQPRKRLLTIGMAQTDPEAAFEDGERQYLARHLTAAFSRARPDEWVVFYLSRPRTSQDGSAVLTVTSGGSFAEGGRLHLVLANFRYAVSRESVLERIRDDPLRPAGEGFYKLIPGIYQTVRRVKRWDLTHPLPTQSQEWVLNYQAFLFSRDAAVVDPEGASSDP